MAVNIAKTCFKLFKRSESGKRHSKMHLHDAGVRYPDTSLENVWSLLVCRQVGGIE